MQKGGTPGFLLFFKTHNAHFIATLIELRSIFPTFGQAVLNPQTATIFYFYKPITTPLTLTRYRLPIRKWFFGSSF